MDSSPTLLYYLASILVGLPIIFYILKKTIRKHIPTKEFLKAWNSVFVFGGIVMFILMQTTDYDGYYFHVLYSVTQHFLKYLLAHHGSKGKNMKKVFMK